LSRIADQLRSPVNVTTDPGHTTRGDTHMTVQRMDNVLIVVDDLEAVTSYEDTNRLAYVRGPEGIIVGLSQQIG
jgi:hypothetical protein